MNLHRALLALLIATATSLSANAETYVASVGGGTVSEAVTESGTYLGQSLNYSYSFSHVIPNNWLQGSPIPLLLQGGVWTPASATTEYPGLGTETYTLSTNGVYTIRKSEYYPADSNSTYSTQRETTVTLDCNTGIYKFHVITTLVGPDTDFHEVEDTASVFTITLTLLHHSIDKVTIFNSHTLQVDATATFSQNSSVSKTITVNTIINGVPLQSVYPLASSATGAQSKSLFIDLAANNVPRFTDNQVFDISMSATENGSVIGSATKIGAEIPLPVVHVHGILTDCFPSYLPTDLWKALMLQHPSYVEDDGYPVLTKTYPTLVSFNYPSLNVDVVVSASQLATWVTNTLLPLTYASKVNIVAHSMGGIMARSAIAYDRIGPQVNKLILVGSPSEGATLAPVALNDWTGIQVAISAVSSSLPVEFRSSLSNLLSCIVHGQQVTARELLPTYPWWSLTRNGPYAVPNSNTYMNPLLPSLNSLGLDEKVRYYAIVASGVPTETFLWGRTYFTGANSSLLDSASRGPGDGIVPINSQKASDLGWPLGTGPGKLNIYGDAGAVFHTDYFTAPSTAIPLTTSILWE